ncbi:MAG: PAS domain S-box protein [Gemmatimonadetes bacterium]|nr:PAS domain S-box protein [Gemmatimonadota bacterium]
MQPDWILNLAGLLTAAAMAGMLAGVLMWFRARFGGERYRLWSLAWLAATAFYLLGASAFSVYSLWPVAHPIRIAVSVLGQVIGFASLVWLAAGTRMFVKGQVQAAGVVQRGLIAAFVVGAGCALGFVTVPGAIWERFLLRVGIHALASAAVFWWAARQLVSAGFAAAQGPRRMLAGAFGLYGLVQFHYFVYAAIRAAGVGPDYQISYLAFLDVLLLAAIGIATVAVALDDQRLETEASARAARDAEAALHRQDRRYRRLIELTHDIITVLDADGVVRYESPSITRILGYGQDECVGQMAFSYVHPEDLPGVLASFQAGSVSKEPTAHRFRFRHKDGRWVWLEAIGQVVDDGDEPSVIVTSRDVTDRERLERQLLEAQKMESVGRLAGGMAHDFNNILTVIKGNVELALHGLPHGSPIRADIEDVGDAAERGGDLTRRLMLFARRQPVVAKVVDLNEVVGRADKLIRRLIGERVDLSVRLASRPIRCRVDPGQIEQVLFNLVANANDAMPGGGALTVAVGVAAITRSLSLGTLPPGSYLTIAVQDTGVGMSEAVKARIFEPFFTTKPAHQGTGLGLATSYGIVWEAGGLIEVASAAGAGSTFTVYLPEVAETEVHVAPHPTAPVRGGRERLLVAEDDEAVRRIAVVALKDLGYQVVEAKDGQDALDRAAPDVELLVTDVVMPRLGGIGLFQQLRQRNPNLPVVFTSGHTDELLDASALPVRSAFLEKPYAPNDLADRIRRLLDAEVPA